MRIDHFLNLQDYAHSTIFLPLRIAWVLSETCSDVARLTDVNVGKCRNLLPSQSL